MSTEFRTDGPPRMQPKPDASSDQGGAASSQGPSPLDTSTPPPATQPPMDQSQVTQLATFTLANGQALSIPRTITVPINDANRSLLEGTELVEKPNFQINIEPSTRPPLMGGYSVVVFGTINGTDKRVAVKLMDQADPKFKEENLQQEAEKHMAIAQGAPNSIIKCYGSTTVPTTGPTYFGVITEAATSYSMRNITQRLCDSDIKDLLQKKGISQSDVIKYLFRQIADANKHIHEKDHIYRDIKDENFLFTLEGDIRLIDFGTCQPISATETLNQLLQGTVTHFAPEVIIQHPENFPIVTSRYLFSDELPLSSALLIEERFDQLADRLSELTGAYVTPELAQFLSEDETGIPNDYLFTQLISSQSKNEFFQCLPPDLANDPQIKNLLQPLVDDAPIPRRLAKTLLEHLNIQQRESFFNSFSSNEMQELMYDIGMQWTDLLEEITLPSSINLDDLRTLAEKINQNQQLLDTENESENPTESKITELTNSINSSTAEATEIIRQITKSLTRANKSKIIKSYYPKVQMFFLETFHDDYKDEFNAFVKKFLPSYIEKHKDSMSPTELSSYTELNLSEDASPIDQLTIEERIDITRKIARDRLDDRLTTLRSIPISPLSDNWAIGVLLLETIAGAGLPVISKPENQTLYFSEMIGRAPHCSIQLDEYPYEKIDLPAQEKEKLQEALNRLLTIENRATLDEFLASDYMSSGTSLSQEQAREAIQIILATPPTM